MRKPNTHPKGYWTLERCKAESLKYSSLAELKTNCRACAQRIQKKGWHDECFQHFTDYKRPRSYAYWTKERCVEFCKPFRTMKELKRRSELVPKIIKQNGWEDECYANLIRKKSPGYWDNIELCKAEAEKYKSLKDFYANNKHVPRIIREHGWQEECYAHFSDWTRQVRRGYWDSLEHCKTAALKYETYMEFRKAHTQADLKILQNGWQDECYAHFDIKHKRPMPSFEECMAIAQKYRTRSDFKHSKEDAWLYERLTDNNLYPECFEHMDKLHNANERCIYVVTFTDNHAYVGLTCNHHKRFVNHCNDEKSPVHKHIIHTGLQPTLTIIHDYTLASEAKILEGQYIKQYKNEGWNMLNRSMNGGQMGGISLKPKNKSKLNVK